MNRPSSSVARVSCLPPRPTPLPAANNPCPPMHLTPHSAASRPHLLMHPSTLLAPPVQPSQVIPPPHEAIEEYQGMVDVVYDASTKPQLEIVRDGKNKVIGLAPQECAKESREIFCERIDVGATEWKKVSKSTKNFYYAEFGKDFKWRQAENAQIRAAWETVSSRRYSDWVSRLKTKTWEMGKDMPLCFTPQCWDSFIDHWLDPEHQKISLRNKKNRRCGSENLEAKALATHTGGSKPHRMHAKEKAELAGGVFPKHIDLYTDLHKQKDNGDHHYNSRINGVVTEFNKRKADEETLLSQMSSDSTVNHLPMDDNERFFYVIGPPKKGRWTGALTETSITPIGGIRGFASTTPGPASQSAIEDRIFERVLIAVCSSLTIKETIHEVVQDMIANKETNIFKDTDYTGEEWMDTNDETTMSDEIDRVADINNDIDDNVTTVVETNVGVNDQQFLVNLLSDNGRLDNSDHTF